MTVTAALYQEYESHMQQAIDFAQARDKVDLRDIKLVIVPSEAEITLGTSGNPAIYLNKASKPDVIAERYTTPLSAYAQSHTAEEVRIRDIVLDSKFGKCVLVKEMPTDTPENKLKLIAILWHEMGHGFNERKPLKNDEQNAYRFEIDMLADPAKQTYLLQRSVAAADIRRYLAFRYSQYVMGPDEKDTLKKVQDLTKALCASIFAPGALAPSNQAPVVTVKIRGNLNMDPFFPMDLEKALAENASAAQSGLRAVIAGPQAQRDKIRSWILFSIAAQTDRGKRVSLSQTESDHAAAEIRLYRV